ncbi:TetR/AcrR family transcriptional regulator [Gordonia sp. NPDC003585]|uniref:TetR/AcrR family transcriptional regulator n=1 Tax=Gordonia sp. NPDC003585 TaxID=3154275 RepID=UPI0033A0DE54
MGTTTRSKRAENRAAMEAEIRRLGREQLTTYGAAGLSLRAIARDLGVVSSAVYRYVPSRDDLLTLLVVEAYTDLADTVDAAAAADGTNRERILAMALAVRRWAVADPARWALLYGSPVPGYAAPAEQTVGPGTRVVGAVLRQLSDAYDASALRTDIDCPTTVSTAEMDAIGTEFDLRLPPGQMLAATTIWATLIGAVSLEVFGQYGADTFTDPESLFAAQIDLALSHLFA